MRYFLFKKDGEEILVSSESENLAKEEIAKNTKLSESVSEFSVSEIGINYAIAYCALYDKESYCSHEEVVNVVSSEEEESSILCKIDTIS